MNLPAHKRVVVHIGYPKCASTYLQQVVFPRLGNFANLSNVTYEESALLYHRSMQPDRYRKIVDRHTVPANGEKPCQILSCESYVELPFLGFERNFGRVAGLKGIDPAPYEHSNKLICENLFRVWPEAYILIVIREPLHWAVSRYNHWYRRDLVAEPLEVCLDAIGESYDRLVQQYVDRFGPEHVRVVPYEWLNQAPGIFLRAVTEFVDPGFNSEIPNVRMNAMPLSVGEVEYRRLRYRLKHRRKSGPGYGIRRVEEALLLPLLRPYCWMKYGGRAQKSVVPEETIQRLLPQLQASHRRLAEFTGLDIKALGYDTGLETGL